jgi:hypothetical protein
MVTKFRCTKIVQPRSAPVHGVMNDLPFFLPTRPGATWRNGGAFYASIGPPMLSLYRSSFSQFPFGFEII